MSSAGLILPASSVFPTIRRMNTSSIGWVCAWSRTVVLCCWLLSLPDARGETDPAVKQATAVAATEAPAPRIRFEQQPTQVGERAVQRLGADLTVEAKIVQSGQVANESTTRMRRQQQRTIDVLEAAEGRVTQARVSFQTSRRQSPENADPNDFSPQPIEGKTYLMRREGDKLTVTDAEGDIPPLEEFKLAMESLESVGKPNPLADLLTGRTLAVGERLLVPREMARTILGLGDQLGTIRRFELTLVRTAESKSDERPDDIATTAIFKAHIEVAPDNASPLSVTLDGELAVEPSTCRLLSIDLAGPVAMSSVERTAGGIYQYSAAGQLKMAMRSQFGRDAK